MKHTKKNKKGFVAARVDEDDLRILRKFNINVSSLISDAIKREAKKLSAN